MTVGAFGLLQLSRSRKWTFGLPLVLASYGGAPMGGGTYMSGFHIGRGAFFEVLGGVVSGVKRTNTLVGDPNTNSLTYVTGYSSATGFGVGASLGLNIEIAAKLGLNIEAIVAKELSAYGFVGGVFVGPSFFPLGTRKP